MNVYVNYQKMFHMVAERTLEAKLVENWRDHSSDGELRQRSVADEMLAINETIKALDDDDAPEIFENLPFDTSSTEHRRDGGTSHERISWVSQDAQ